MTSLVTPTALHVCTRYLRGGSERRIRDIISALPDMEHHLVVGADSDAESARGHTGATSVRVLPSLLRRVAPYHDVAALVRLWRILSFGQYDLMFTHQSKAGILGRVAAIAAHGPSVIHSASMASHGPGYSPVENLVFRRLERALARHTAAFCVVGHDLARRYLELGVSPDKVHVVRSGVWLPSVGKVREHALQLVQSRYGVPQGRPVITYVGSLEHRKNVLLLPDVLDQLVSGASADPTLLIMGDGPERERLEDRLRQLGLERHAILTGYVPAPEHVSDALRASDLVLLLSSAEGLPQVLVQSATSGTPFVAFDVDGVRELLSIGAVGEVVALGDVAGVVAAARRRLEAPVTWSEPTIDRSSWSREAVEAAYRSVAHAVMADSRVRWRE